MKIKTKIILFAVFSIQYRLPAIQPFEDFIADVKLGTAVDNRRNSVEGLS